MLFLIFVGSATTICSWDASFGLQISLSLVMRVVCMMGSRACCCLAGCTAPALFLEWNETVYTELQLAAICHIGVVYAAHYPELEAIRQRCPVTVSHTALHRP